MLVLISEITHCFFSIILNVFKAFEPQKKIFKILKINTENYSNIEVFNYGLDSRFHNSKFYIPYSNSGMANQSIKELAGYYENVKF
jgi:hypothetical protein